MSSSTPISAGGIAGPLYLALGSGTAAETSSAPVGPRRFTVDEYYRMAEVGILAHDERVELIDGVVIEMNPVGGRHGQCVDELTEMLVTRLAGRYRVRVQNPIRLSAVSQPQPDLSILTLDWHWKGVPHPMPAGVVIAIEVADSSLPVDRRLKIPLYASSGIGETWLIDLQHDLIEVHDKPGKGAYEELRTFHAGGQLVSTVVPELSLDVARILGV